jgi:enterochelin esterase family protein
MLRAMRRGTIDRWRFESALLRGNPLGDPHVRDIPVYLPPSYATDETRRFPVVFVLAGYTGTGRMMLNERAWFDPLDARMDRLIDAGACGEMILVIPDGMTRLGGSQYLDSPAQGPYESHVAVELAAAVEDRYRTLPAPRHWGVAGKSSGGYGAAVLGFRHPDRFSALASHSGDSAFEHCYLPDFAPTVRALDAHDGSIRRFVEAFERKPKKSPQDMTAIMTIAMAAAYSPDAGAEMGIALPFSWPTGEIVPAVWDRWLAWDPVRMAERLADSIRRLRAVFVDCGKSDEFRLYVGARQLAEELRAMGADVRHEEFEDTHMSIEYRYDVSLPFLWNALCPQ